MYTCVYMCIYIYIYIHMCIYICSMCVYMCIRQRAVSEAFPHLPARARFVTDVRTPEFAYHNHSEQVPDIYLTWSHPDYGLAFGGLLDECVFEAQNSDLQPRMRATSAVCCKEDDGDDEDIWIRKRAKTHLSNTKHMHTREHLRIRP